MKTKKLLSVLLALTMVVSMVATLSVTASAEELTKITGVMDLTATWPEIGATDSDKMFDVTVSGYDSEKLELVGTVFVENICEEDEAATDTIEASKEYAVCVFFKAKEGYCFGEKNEYEYTEAITMNGEKTFCNLYREININNNPLNCTWGELDDNTYLGVFLLGVVFDSNSCYLDLDSTTTDISEKKELDQNYNLTVNEVKGADVTKVKLSWEINDINATRTDNKVWDTENLCWTTSTSSTEIKQAGTAKFTLENYSSVKVDATVTFDTAEYAAGKKFSAPTIAFDETTGTDGKITLDTANGNNTYSKENPPKGEIDVTVTPVADDFKTLAATTKATKYGTYTVTISQSVEKKVTVLKKSEGGNTYLYVELTGFDAGEHTYVWSHNWNGSKRDGDMTTIPTNVTVEDNGAKLNLGSSPWNYNGNYRVTVDGISSELTDDSYVGG